MQNHNTNQPGTIKTNQNQIIWAFDLGLASIGEAILETRIDQNGQPESKILHAASLLIPAELGSIKDARAKRRALRTRQSHKKREAWLDHLWKQADLTPLQKRTPYWDSETKKWTPEKCQKADYRLEREFPPAWIHPKGSAKDGAPAATEADLAICYNSALLRIKLLRGEKLQEWQIYKALRAALQNRGQQTVPWIAREAARVGKTPEELLEEEKKALEDKDPSYKDAMTKWQNFCQLDFIKNNPDYQYPCYYDAYKIGLWNPAQPDSFKNKPDHNAASTQQVVFPGDRVEAELLLLAQNAVNQLPALQNAYKKVINQFLADRRQRIEKINLKRQARAQALNQTPKLLPTENLPHAKNFAELFVYGPAGKPDLPSGHRNIALADASIARALALRPGTDFDHQSAIGQKIPRFDNRILAHCALFPRLHVCRNSIKFKKTSSLQGRKCLDPKSILAAEVTFLLQAKNLQVEESNKIRFLSTDEIRGLLALAKRKVRKALKEGKNESQIIECYKLSSTAWRSWCNNKNLSPISFASNAKADEQALAETSSEAFDEAESKPQQKSDHVIKAPRPTGRSRFSRPALNILRYLLLNATPEQTPHAILDRLSDGDADLCAKLKFTVLQTPYVCEKQNQSKKYQVHISSPRTWILKEELEAMKLIWTASDDQKTNPIPYSPNQIRIPDLKLRNLRKKYQLTDDSYINLLECSKSSEPNVRAVAQKQIEARNRAVLELIGEQNNPIVRDRLERFYKRLLYFQNRLNQLDPDCVVLEFVRDDRDNSLDGQARKQAYLDVLKRNEQKREEIRSKLLKENVPVNNETILRRMLWEEQGCACIYSNKSIGCSNYLSCEIEHIVPRSMGGPDAYWNWVLADPDANAEKGNRTPYQWFHEEKTEEEWGAYKARVLALAPQLGRRKVELLLRADAHELVGEKYTSLASTAWIARLAQSILRLHFGWPLDDESGQERVITISGGLTARIRRKYLLDSLLGPLEPMKQHSDDHPDPAILRNSIDEKLNKIEQLSSINDKLKKLSELSEIKKLAELSEKNREDQRHHALDAILLTFLPNWLRDKNKEDFFRMVEIGDSPVYSTQGAEQKKVIFAEIRRLYEENENVFTQIREAKKQGNNEALKRLRDSILDVRKQMAVLYKSIEKLKQPRNIKAVREWFRMQLWDQKNVDSSIQIIPKIIPQNVGVLRKPIESTVYAARYLIKNEKQREGVALNELGLRKDFHNPSQKLFDIRYLFTQLQAITKLVGSNNEDDAKKLKSVIQNMLQQSSLLTQETWKTISESCEVRNCFPRKGGKRNPRLLEPAECKVVLNKIDILPTSRPLGNLTIKDLAYSTGKTWQYDEEHLDNMIPKICQRVQITKTRAKQDLKSGQFAASINQEQDDICPKWPSFVFAEDLQEKFKSQGFRQKLKELANHLPGTSPGKGASSEEKKNFEEREKKWKEASERFLVDQAINHHPLPKTVYLYDESQPEPPPRKRGTKIWDILFRVVLRQFSVDGLRKQIKKISHLQLAEDVGFFADSLESIQEPKEQERLWIEYTKVVKLIPKKMRQDFFSQNSRPTPQDFINLLSSLSGPVIRKINQTAGTDLSEYADLSKDGTGQWYRGSNKGYFITRRKKNSGGTGDDFENYEYFAHAVRFFESKTKALERLTSEGWELLDNKLWQWGMVLNLPKEAGTKQRPIKPGYYFLGSISNGTGVNLNSVFGEDVPQNLSLKSLLIAGLNRQS